MLKRVLQKLLFCAISDLFQSTFNEGAVAWKMIILVGNQGVMTTTKNIQCEFFPQQETFSQWIFIIVVKALYLLKTKSVELVRMVSKWRHFATKPENLALVSLARTWWWELPSALHTCALMCVPALTTTKSINQNNVMVSCLKYSSLWLCN